MEWYVGVLRKYAEFSGRARRKEYWMFFLINMLIAMGIGFVEGFTGLARNGNTGPVSDLYSLAVLVPSIAVGVRRMHDTDHSGWWLLLPIVNLVFLATNGQAGPNKYGPDPKAGEGYVAAAPVPAAAPPAYDPYASSAAPPAQPQAPAPAAPPVETASAPAAWLADPTGRHEYRYWDGQKWTENVSDSGVTSTDPV